MLAAEGAFFWAPDGQTVLHRRIVLLAHEVVVPEGVVWPGKQPSPSTPMQTSPRIPHRLTAISSQAFARLHHEEAQEDVTFNRHCRVLQ